jgi:hypothetical protein
MTAVAESDVHALCDLLLAEVHPQSTAVEEFPGRRFDLGLAWVPFPVGEGGLGAPRELQRIVNERMSEVGGKEGSDAANRCNYWQRRSSVRNR